MDHPLLVVKKLVMSDQAIAPFTNDYTKHFLFSIFTQIASKEEFPFLKLLSRPSWRTWAKQQSAKSAAKSSLRSVRALFYSLNCIVSRLIDRMVNWIGF